MSKRLFSKRKPGLFTPKYRNQEGKIVSSIVNTNKFIETENRLIKDTNFESTASFRYQNKEGVVSTQELNIDFSFFENHTFFHSAVAKVNESFDLILLRHDKWNQTYLRKNQKKRNFKINIIS